MADPLTIQQALVGVTRDSATAVKETPPEEWTMGAVQTRLEVLRNYWVDFQSNHLNPLTLMGS